MIKFYFFLVFLTEIPFFKGELWEQDLTSSMKIGLSMKGYKSVDLRCDDDHFAVNVTLEDDFEGVVYTRGSFNDKKSPCFKRHNQVILREDNKLLIGLWIPFEKCKTLMDVSESRYTNTLVIQHDPDLIMPGDAAFSLDCAFVPEFKVSADMNVKSKPAQTNLSYLSKITLVDADPSEKTDPGKQNFTVFSKSEKVTFTPNSNLLKDEL